MSLLADPSAQPASSQTIPAADYDFASNVRFLAMAAVVFVHCIIPSFRIAGIRPAATLERATHQPLCFDVIGFFLVSGFLMEGSLKRRSPAEYFKRRIRRIVIPWLFWVSIFFAVLLAGDLLHGRLELAWREGASWIGHQFLFCLFSTAYWFVPNLLIALCILLACRRFLFDLRLGCVLLTLSLFYGVNIHAHWVPFQNHSEALLGFVFYLWLGAFAARNFAAIQTWIMRIPTIALLGLAALAGCAAFAESSVLCDAGNLYPMNTLRICNQAYAVLLVLAVFKLSGSAWLQVLKVRATTFGIYLIHPVMAMVVMSLIKRTVGESLTGEPAVLVATIAVCLSLGGFIVVYGSSFFLACWLLGHPRLRWVVGGHTATEYARAKVLQDTAV